MASSLFLLLFILFIAFILILDMKVIDKDAIKSLEKSHKIKTWIYPAETYSKNVLLKENEVVITSSSFNLTPVKVIKL